MKQIRKERNDDKISRIVHAKKIDDATARTIEIQMRNEKPTTKDEKDQLAGYNLRKSHKIEAIPDAPTCKFLMNNKKTRENVELCAEPSNAFYKLVNIFMQPIDGLPTEQVFKIEEKRMSKQAVYYAFEMILSMGYNGLFDNRTKEELAPVLKPEELWKFYLEKRNDLKYSFGPNIETDILTWIKTGSTNLFMDIFKIKINNLMIKTPWKQVMNDKGKCIAVIYRECTYKPSRNDHKKYQAEVILWKKSAQLEQMRESIKDKVDLDKSAENVNRYIDGLTKYIEKQPIEVQDAFWG